MSDFEWEIRAGLQRIPAPDGFADRVMELARRRERKREVRGWMAAAASLVILFIAALAGETHYERQKAEIAQQQLGIAIQVTSKALAHAEERVALVSLRSFEEEQ